MKVRILDTWAVLLGKATASGREEATQASLELAWRVGKSKRSVPRGRSRESWRRWDFIFGGDRLALGSPLGPTGV